MWRQYSYGPEWMYAGGMDVKMGVLVGYLVYSGASWLIYAGLSYENNLDLAIRTAIGLVYILVGFYASTKGTGHRFLLVVTLITCVASIIYSGIFMVDVISRNVLVALASILEMLYTVILIVYLCDDDVRKQFLG